MVENGRAILLPHIRALLIQLGGVVYFKKAAHQLFISRLFRIKSDFNAFCAASGTVTDLRISGVLHMPSCISRHCLYYSRRTPEGILDAPEAPGREGRELCVSLVSHIYIKAPRPCRR